jgi:hypothetical protein
MGEHCRPSSDLRGFATKSDNTHKKYYTKSCIRHANWNAEMRILKLDMCS